ncbi:MAG TPA: myo-inositol-1-phosphate synthase [Planctomycetes bacterium]|nr:myo-inositol-1-phosphate synthase [Planctomycetota bacterium]
MNGENEQERSHRLGVWLIGARGAISTCVAYGLAGLRDGIVEPVGLVTEKEPLRSLGMRAFEDFVLGGHEIARTDLSRSAAELARNGVLPRDLVAAASADAAAFEARIRPGLLDLGEVGRAELDPESAALGGAPIRERVDRIRGDLEAFRDEHDLERVVVVYLASTEPLREPAPSWETLEAFEEAIESGEDLPASCLYAYAAFRAKAPFVNFTPNRGASIPALCELALAEGVPHCGNDGKTGETLIKSALAPMFAARALRVLAWQGYNMLGNGDGAALADPSRRATKCASKDKALHAILDDEDLHTGVEIDFVPSLHDWKTAMDFVHFEGFLGAKMSLQFTWSGSDSALAAPLVVDLVRLADLAASRGEVGGMAHTACFFKSPLDGGTHDFHAQFRALMAYAAAR